MPVAQVTGEKQWRATVSAAIDAAGSVGSGTANQLAYYQATGTALVGLASANSGILVTDGSGVPSISTVIPNGATATTQTAGDTSNKVATDLFVANAIGSVGAATGTIQHTIESAEPSGWLFLTGKTIGDASSGGTSRANADTSALFTFLWTNLANAQAAVSGGRGVSAAADYAAHKTIALPFVNGRPLVALDNMGGTAAGVLPVASVPGSQTLGGNGGAATVTLTAAQQASMPVTVTTPSNVASTAVGAGQAALGTDVFTTVSTTATGTATGSGGAHPNVQPVFFVNIKIKL